MVYLTFGVILAVYWYALINRKYYTALFTFLLLPFSDILFRIYGLDIPNFILVYIVFGFTGGFINAYNTYNIGKKLLDWKSGIPFFDDQTKVMKYHMDNTKAIMYLPFYSAIDIAIVKEKGKLHIYGKSADDNNDKKKEFMELINYRQSIYNFILYIPPYLSRYSNDKEFVLKLCELVNESKLPICYITVKLPDHTLIKFNTFKDIKLFVYENWQNYI